MTKKILVAHDFSEPAQRALALATDLAKAMGASIDVVHVHPEIYNGRGDPALALPWPNQDQEERYLRFLDTELERVVRDVIGDQTLEVKRHVVRGDPLKGIEAVALEVGADLLCQGSTGKGTVARVLLGSVSQQVLRTLQIPVLTVH